VSITAHQRQLTPKDPGYMGSDWNTLTSWEDGSSTYEPLHIIGKDQPDLCAQYALDNNLLEKMVGSSFDAGPRTRKPWTKK